jgi:hypothetical protein
MVDELAKEYATREPVTPINERRCPEPGTYPVDDATDEDVMMAMRRDMLNDYGDEEAIVDEAITDYHSSVERIKLQISTGGIVAAMRRARRTASGGNNKITIHLLRRANIQSRNNKVAELIAVIGTRWCSEEYQSSGSSAR